MKKIKWIFIILSLIITVSDSRLIYAESKQRQVYLYDYDDGIPIVNLNELEDENDDNSDASSDYIDRDDDDDEYSYTETEEERQKREAEEQERERKYKEDEERRIKKQAEKFAKKRKPIIEFAEKVTKKHKSKRDKIKAIHDAICKHAKYDWELYRNGGGSYFEEDGGSAYTNSVIENALHILKKKKGVCGHYASLFTECCRAINIESEVVCSDDHAWSEVILDKKKYIVDVTFDDNEKISYSHFMIKEHPITKKLRDREKYLKTTKLPKYEEKFAKIDKMNIKNEKEYLQVMSYIAHNLEKGKSYKNLKLRVLDKKFNAYKHLNAVFLLNCYALYGYDYKTRTYTFSFNY